MTVVLVKTIPVNGCSLPMTRSPLHSVRMVKFLEIELWERMFKFAWNQNHSVDGSCDTMITSDSESESSEDSEKSDNQVKNETDYDEESVDFWPDL